MPLLSLRSLFRTGALAATLCLGSAAALGAGESTPGMFANPDYSSSTDIRNSGSNQRGDGFGGTGGGFSSPTTIRNDNPLRGDPSFANQDRTGVTRPGVRADLPPPKPSEFQKFVEAATGRRLQNFGNRFFTDAADSFSPVDNVPVSADYMVGPGDQILIRAWGSIDVDYRATVDRSGQISLPKVGTFTVAGTRASNLESHLRGQIGRLFTNFNLNVTLGQLRGVKVFVVGPARVPGVYTLASQSTLLSAVVAAGGPSPNGSMRKVGLRRDGKIVAELDIYDFLVQGDKSRDVQLTAGDVVVFQPAGPRVALTGAIDSPAIYELKDAQEPVSEVLRYSGDTGVLVNPNRVQIERIDPQRAGAARFVEEFKLDADGLKKPLKDGDVVTLLAISPAFANAVTLKGAVAQPLRYPHREGMRIRDLIPDREALISPDFYRRKNLLVQVTEEEEDEQQLQRESRRYTGTDLPRNGERMDTRSTDDLNDSELLRERARQRDGRSRPPARGAEAGALAGADAERLPRERDRDRLDPRDEDRNRSSVSTRRRPAAPLFDELNWDYAVIERLNKADLTTQVIPFNLGKAVLQGDEANNLALLPGDVVTVFSQKDVRVPVSRQTRMVSVLGEVGAPGTYQLLPGETLPQLIARAGGLTSQAYIYGLEFSREETRQRQRENLASAIERLEALSSIQAARDAANRANETAAAGAAISSAATQAQIGRLSRMEPNGRIALELTPDVDSLSDLPEVPLEHQDQIVVPTRPAFVTVAGAVVNNNAFLWKPGKTVGEYIGSAGLDDAAEPSNMFILRADGTVLHASESRGFFGGSNLDSVALNPGDALVVPNKLDYETWGRALVRNLKDWSQIFSQFGLGAAAIITLRNN
ncbi:SLBB domain-containing protein [Rhizobacter sp. LjRoot28]|uniref:polysaccharide biosynthesis/export family protein n=1 Tax=Rhizobacter sp. LjRoot28 TaxID=3342309 RepID=UPI003ECE7305